MVAVLLTTVSSWSRTRHLYFIFDIHKDYFGNGKGQIGSSERELVASQKIPPAILISAIGDLAKRIAACEHICVLKLLNPLGDSNTLERGAFSEGIKHDLLHSNGKDHGFREEQPKKARLDIVLSLIGRETSSRLLQPSKRDSSISPILSDSFTDSSAKQDAKALNSTRTQLSGISICVRLKQKANAPEPII